MRTSRNVSCSPSPLHPLLPAITEFLQQAAENVLGRLSPQVAPNTRATRDLPNAVAELMATAKSINILLVETKDAKRFQLPPKDSGVLWDMLTHRFTMELPQGEVLGVQFVRLGQPADGVKDR